MKLYSKNIKIGHPAVPWIIAVKLGKEPYIFQISVDLKIHIGIIEDGINIEFNHLSYDVMGELMVKFKMWPYYDKTSKKWWPGKSGEAAFEYMHVREDTPQDAVAMGVIRMEEYYDDIPEELL